MANDRQQPGGHASGACTLDTSCCGNDVNLLRCMLHEADCIIYYASHNAIDGGPKSDKEAKPVLEAFGEIVAEIKKHLSCVHERNIDSKLFGEFYGLYARMAKSIQPVTARGIIDSDYHRCDDLDIGACHSPNEQGTAKKKGNVILTRLRRIAKKYISDFIAFRWLLAFIAYFILILSIYISFVSIVGATVLYELNSNIKRQIETTREFREKSQNDKAGEKTGKEKVKESQTMISEKLKLSNELNFPENLKKKIYYDNCRQLLIFNGIMSEEEKKALLSLSKDNSYNNAINSLFQRSQAHSTDKDDKKRVALADILKDSSCSNSIDSLFQQMQTRANDKDIELNRKLYFIKIRILGLEDELKEWITGSYVSLIRKFLSIEKHDEKMQLLTNYECHYFFGSLIQERDEKQTQEIHSRLRLMSVTRDVLIVSFQFILLVLYGFLGASAYLLKQRYDGIASTTYTSKLAVISWIRLVSGAIGGFCIGWFVPPSEILSAISYKPTSVTHSENIILQVMLYPEVASLTLPLIVAFLGGYSSDMFFNIIGRIITAVSGEKDTPRASK